MKKPGTNPAKKEKDCCPTKKGLTRVIIKYDIGFPNQLYIRGEGAGLNWERGFVLRNVSADEWIWETSTPFDKCEFKVLINDATYEVGENRQVCCGAELQYTPAFS